MHHITNGESTSSLLKQIGITKNVISFFDMLCDGPCQVDMDGQEFIETRQTFFEQIGVSKDDYMRRYTGFMDFIDAMNEEEEITLYFEYDLFCQANLIGLLSLLDRKSKTDSLFIVCPGILNQGEMKYVSYCSEVELQELIKQRRKITKEDVHLATNAYEHWTTNREEPFAGRTENLPFIEKAVEQHIKWRIPDVKGRTEIERFILSIKNDDSTVKSLVKECLMNKDFHYLGLGDMQYEVIVENMQGK